MICSENPRWKKVRTILLYHLAALLLLVGLYTIVKPIVVSYKNSQRSIELVQHVEAKLETMPNEYQSQMIQTYTHYNQYVLASLKQEMWHEQDVDYYELPRIDSNNVIGSITVPTLGINNLAIYHDDKEKELSSGVGHVPYTSIPLGNAEEHAVLAAHSGREHMTLFSNLEQLACGDTFTISILGMKHQYKVMDVNIVLPEETDVLQQTGELSLVTLATCYPTGVNTHRLLVTGELVAEVGAEVPAPAKIKSIVFNDYRWRAYAMLGVLVIILIHVVFLNRKLYSR